MTLTTHSVVGASIAVLSSANPFAAFLLGFTSHFLLDSIPHWDYPLASGNKAVDPMENDLIVGKSFLVDLLYIAIDASLGLLLGLLLLPSYHMGFTPLLQSPILWSIIGAVLPDLLQFVYFKTKAEPFTTIYRFHKFIHAQYRFPDTSIIGIGIQVFIIGGLLSRFLLY